MKKLMLVCFVLMCCVTAMAQTDVTAQYVKNSEFGNGSDFVKTDIFTYEKDAAGAVYSYQKVSEWTADGEGEAKAAGCVGIASGNGLSGAGYKAPLFNASHKQQGGTLGLAGCWGNSVGYSQAATLPAGTYRVSYMVYNAGSNIIANYTNTCGFIADNGTKYYSDAEFYTGEWTRGTVYFTLNEETSGKIHLGYDCANVGSAGTPKIFIDYVRIEKFGATDNVNDMMSKVDSNWGGAATYSAEGVVGHEAFLWGASLPLADHLVKTITGLPNGTYNVVALVGASSTSGRDNTSNVIDELSTKYVSLHANNKSMGVPAYNRDKITKFDRVELDNVSVTDGTLKIYLHEDVSGPNWLVLAIKSIKCVSVDTTPYIYKNGDINNDNEVDVTDVTELVDVILHNKDHKVNYDVNMDYGTDITDVTSLVGLILDNKETQIIDRTNDSYEASIIVYPEQSAAENAEGPNALVVSATNTLTGANCIDKIDLSQFFTTINITTTLPDIASISVYANCKEKITGGLEVSKRGVDFCMMEKNGKVGEYSLLGRGSVISVTNPTSSLTTVYLLPIHLSYGVTVTVKCKDGKYYSQNFDFIDSGEVNDLTFTSTVPTQTWMATMPGNVAFTALTLPGSHDSATKGCSKNFTETQSLTIAEQLAVGVRSLDLRPRATGSTTADNMYIYHGSEKTQVLFKDALADVVSFLEQNPSESVFLLLHEEDENNLDAWRNAVMTCLNNVKDYIKVIDGNMSLDECRGKMVIISRDNVGATDLCGKCGWGSSFNDKTVYKGSDTGAATPWVLMYQDEYAYTNDFNTSRIAKVEKLQNDYINPNATNLNRIYFNSTNVAYKLFSQNSYIPTTAAILNSDFINSTTFKNSNVRWGIISSDYIGDATYYGDKLLDMIIAQNYKYINKGQTRNY